MKIEVLTGGGVCGSFATHTPPLDSGFRRNDEGKPRNIIFVPMTKLGRRDHREPLTLQGPSILLPMTIVGGGMSQERRY